MEIPQVPLNRDLTYLGLSTFRDRNQLFGIKRKDRRQHVYILGKSGTGKSVLMFNMIIQNIINGEGVCVVDPHGELVEGVLSAIPPHRMKDVIYFNPADPDYHIGFNVLELVDPQYKHLVASGLMGIFTKIWANAWSARMEYILNNTILALLDTPGTTLLGIPRMLVDKDYRQKIISNLKDPVIKAFWVHEYEAWQDKFRNEAIAPIQNKVGQFLSTSIIRNVVGQSVSTINVFDIMNGSKIFLVNVSKGRIGEDNSSLLGGMIITKIQLAAMERVRIPEEVRRDFYLYVDEFQNFVTDAFAGILSEARKYRLNLTVAHQYTAQLISDKSSAVRDAIFGNVGTMIVFRVGADDADFLEKEFDPEFTPGDIVNLPNYKIYLKLMIDGITSRPFSARTLPPMVKSGNKEIEEEVIRSSRELYCKTKESVEREINNWSGMSLGDIVESGGGSGTWNGDKFPAICSSCKKETTVPFKPEPGRPVYCKECVAKIKSGEITPVKGSTLPQQPKVRDDAKFFKPLSDLGIEFVSKDVPVDAPRAPAPRVDRPVVNTPPRPAMPPQPAKPASQNNTKPGFFAGLKKALPVAPAPIAKPQPTKSIKENIPLKEILSKTLAEDKPVPENVVPVTPPPVAPVSLSSLKSDASKVSVPANNSPKEGKKDLSASAEDMNKLKNIISQNVQAPPAPPQPPAPPAPTPQVISETPPPPQPQPATAVNKVREVPEEVLRKILE